MRLFFVLDEGIYHPEFFADFLRRTKDKVVGVALVTKVPKKNNIERYFLKHLNYFTPEELAKMAWTKADMKSKNAFQQKNANSKFYSVKSVLEFFHIPFFRVKEDINKKEYIFKMRGFEPDVIISSNPLIFGKEILALDFRQGNFSIAKDMLPQQALCPSPIIWRSASCLTGL